jgi:hypothetical protein
MNESYTFVEVEQLRTVKACMKGGNQIFDQEIPAEVTCSWCLDNPVFVVITETAPDEMEMAAFCYFHSLPDDEVKH